jgi:PmbA protein
LLILGKKLLSSLKISTGWNAEIFLERKRFREVAWAEKRPKDTRSGWSEGMSLRAIHRGRQGFAYANDISVDSARRLWDAASTASAFLPVDEHRVLPAPRPSKGGAVRLDPALFGGTIKGHQARLARWEKSILSSDRRLKKVLGLSIKEHLVHEAVLNSLGVAVKKSSGAASLDIELMGEVKGDVQVAWSYAVSRAWKDLRTDLVFDGAKRRLLEAFGAQPLPSGTMPVVFDPWVGAEFLDTLSAALGADAVQRGKSLFAGKLGQELASPLVTLIDDGRFPGGMATDPYDDEGFPTQTTVLVENGVLKEFLYDSYTAAREGRASTGNAVRGGIAGPPMCDASNFYMAPGRLPPEKLIAETSKAFWVHEVLGMHTADAVSGDFSVGASGLLIEKGKVARAVKGVTLAGNFLDLLKNVDAVANDLTWYGSTGSPTFRVSALSIGGS